MLGSEQGTFLGWENIYTKTFVYLKKYAVSPTGMLELAKLKEQTKMDRQKIEHLEDRIKYLEEANSELKNDKEFLLSQMKGAPSAPASTGKSGILGTQLPLFMEF